MLQDAKKLQADMAAWRRVLHQMPELGLHLPKTVDFVSSQLRKMGVDFQIFPEISCIAAQIGAGEACFLLRADMDALPIREQTGLPFGAVNGNMHACGHDLHTAMLLGAAKLLKDRESGLQGRVKLLFQAGEEIFAGAKAALEAGILGDVQGALALHAVSALPVGMAVTGMRPMAAVDGFCIEVTGRGGHGSSPEACIDPINGAVQIYLALQSLMAREVGGTQEAVLTVGQLAAGESGNVIPHTALLRGTLRSFDPALREYLLRRIRELSLAVATAYRCRCRVERECGCPALVEDAQLLELAVECIKKDLPDMTVQTDAHGMGSEDFAFIAQRVPAAYVMLGAAGEGAVFGQHHPKVIFSEKVLPVGAAIFASVAERFLREK